MTFQVRGYNYSYTRESKISNCSPVMLLGRAMSYHTSSHTKKFRYYKNKLEKVVTLTLEENQFYSHKRFAFRTKRVISLPIDKGL